MPITLLKGIEEEVLLGTPDWHAVALSDLVAAQHGDFSVEPDGRSVEFVAGPHLGYAELGAELVAKRVALRRMLANWGGVRITPGAALPLERRTEFHLSDPSNPYYRFIRQTYGDRVVTAGAHISIGFDDPQHLFRVCRVLRCEAAMYLALSASSPFYRGKLSGYHSTRWNIFPRTPEFVPLFQDHAHFITWVQAQLRSRQMFNRRHLWVSVRPNGPNSPDALDRLELRICDSMLDTEVLLSIAALLEARVLYLLEDPEIDPTADRAESHLLKEIAANEAAAARSSLDAEIIRWTDGVSVPMRSWIAETLAEVTSTAHRAGSVERLGIFQDTAAIENSAQRWIRRVAEGESMLEVLASESSASECRDGFRT